MQTYANECLVFLKKLLMTPSVNGRENEAAVVDVIKAEAEKLGLPCQILEKQTGRPNIFVGGGFHSADEYIEINSLAISLEFLSTIALGEVARVR